MRKHLLVGLCALLLAAPAAAGPEVHSNLGDDVTFGDVPGDLDAAVHDTPLAATRQPGCVTDLIQHNFSSRGSILPRLLVLHYTVSPNRAGWGDVNLIRGLFNRDSFNASSTYLVDFEGNCKLIVDEAAKPWTQTFYNPWSISVEIIARGSEPKAAWLASKGLVKTAQVFADAAKRWNIPIRFVNPGPSCVAPPAGITDHNALDCQNSHTDVRPNFPYTEFMALVRKAATPVVVWRWASGGKILRQIKTGTVVGGKTSYQRIMDWARNNPGIVAAAEKANGLVTLRRVEL